MIELGYGAHRLRLPEGLECEVLAPPSPPAAPDLAAALQEALRRPVGSRPLREVATTRTRAVLVLSRAWTGERCAALYGALRRELAALRDDQITLAIPAGAASPGDPTGLGVPPEVRGRHALVVHDDRDQAGAVEVGRTSRGTRLRVNRCLAEADLVITAGQVRPHCFTGYGGGAEGLFPGLALAEDVRQGRRLEADPASTLGRADQNPCREDIEEAARRLGRDTFMLDVVVAGGAVVSAVAGDLVLAHREGVRRLRPHVEVRAAPAEVVVVSAPLPVSGSFASAARLLPPAGRLLRDGGVVILAAECPEGLGPAEAVEEGVPAPALGRFLPGRHSLLLVSSLDAAAVARTAATRAPSIEAALEEARRLTGLRSRMLVMPDAGDLVPVPVGS